MKIRFLVLAISAAVFFVGCSKEQIIVEVRNVANEPLHSVIVHVTGNSYPIGDIAPGSAKTVKVAPKGESHIEIEHGNKQRVNVGGYYEPGYKGRVFIKMDQNHVVAIKDEVKAGLY